MSPKKPAVSLVAVPKRRAQMLELAKEIEQRGFAGIYCPSASDNMSLCTALAFATDRIPFGTAIAPIYWRTPVEYALAAAFIQEVSNGRFRFGIGVAHAPSHARFGVTVGKPLGDMRQFVSGLRSAERVGELPPIILASMRQKMINLAGEIGQGMIFANGARSHMSTSLAALPEGRAADPNFHIANMVPTCIDDDEDAAMAVNRRTLTSYAHLPNYRNYWREAGFAEEMDAVEAAIAAGEPDRVPDALSKRWLSEVTLFGSPTKVLDGLAAWYDAGIKTPILVPSSAKGNQATAFQEVFDLFK
jgi:alkanesulfonate monooxygenase SsuD/methylene tetrahydromethanopterin reductase-like flavin-dependent oxidoreductase (luciferase family)